MWFELSNELGVHFYKRLLFLVLLQHQLGRDLSLGRRVDVILVNLVILRQNTRGAIAASRSNLSVRNVPSAALHNEPVFDVP